MVKTVILCGLLALASCASTGSGNFCDLSAPIRPSAATLDAMSDAEVASALRHNEVGESLCGWTL